MLLKPLKLEIDPKEPFKNDVFGRKQCAEVFVELVKNSTQPTVLAINSPWGTGKSTFLEMWRHELMSAGFTTILFNAWENDFSDDALASFIGEIEEAFESIKLEAKGKARARNALNKAKKIAGEVMLAAVPTALRIATGGILNVSDKTMDGLAEGVEKIADKKVEEYRAGKASLQKFREALCEFVELLPSIPDSKIEAKLVLIVDELDRCRPPFAIDVLEKIKHIFGVKGLFCVVAVDRRQLGYAVSTIYGSQMDTDGYLRRFFDFEFSFPQSSRRQFAQALIRRFKIDENLHQRQERAHEFTEILLQTFVPLADAFEISLRQQEQCFAQISLVLLATPKGNPLQPVLLSVFVFLKALKTDLYEGYNKGLRAPSDVMAYLKSSPALDEPYREGINWEYVEAVLVSAYSDHKWVRNYLTNLRVTAQSLGRPEEERVKAQDLLDTIQGKQHGYRGVREHLYGRLELLSNFWFLREPQ